MAEKTKHPCPPYATFPTFVNFLNKLRDTQVPGRIDPSVFGNASGSISYSVIAALKAFKLIAADGTPSNEFVGIVKASDEARKPMLANIGIRVYPTFYEGKFDVSNATASQFDEHIRDNYEAKGSTIDKVAAFFIAFCQYTDLPLSELIKARKPLASSASSGKSKRQRRAAENGDDGATGQKAPPPPAITEKALEYRLVDLMSDAIGNPEVMQAIITVVTFLKSRDAAASKTATGQ